MRGLSGPKTFKMSGFHEVWASEFQGVLAAAADAFQDVRIGRPLEEQTEWFVWYFCDCCALLVRHL